MPKDMLMFDKAEFANAMGNSGPEVQAPADVVTDGYDDEGFARAVEHFILQPLSVVQP